MNLADLSIRRPIFMTCVVLLSLIAGLMSMSRLGVDLFPDVTFPVVLVTTPYPGAGPKEVETLVSKPLEDELSTLSGIKRLSSTNQEGVSIVVAEFTLETDVKFAEQQIRDRVGATKMKLPSDIREPTIRRIDPSDMPVLILAVKADLPPAELFDLAHEHIKPRLEQVNRVGLVNILGGRKREIQVQLDRFKLKRHEISASQVAARLTGAGEDIPAGKKSEGQSETVFRTVGQFRSIQDIHSLILTFFGGDVPVRISDVGHIEDTLEDETSRAYINGNNSLFLYAFRQSGSNTIAVVRGLLDRVKQINAQIRDLPGKPEVTVVRDGSVWIQANVDDVKESIFIGVGLAVFVVFLFLGNGRSTVITGLALPNSLIGAFILMAMAGFTINIMTLLALSLSVGLLIDDAIVVRENIFRHIELGEKPVHAAEKGTAEVRLAVIATTLTVIAVFGPLGFLKGVVGQFFKQFGLTICFAMAISLFDALTIAPMLSAYFAGAAHRVPRSQNPILAFFQGLNDNTVGVILRQFSQFQDWLEVIYEKFLIAVLKRWWGPLALGIFSFAIFVLCISAGRYVPNTFLPQQDAGEFSLAIDMPPGTNLQGMSEKALLVDKLIRANREVEVAALTVGKRDGDPNHAEFYVRLIARKNRDVNTSQFKERLRAQLKLFNTLNPKVKDFDAVGGGMRPFTLKISGDNQDALEKTGLAVLTRLQQVKGLKDVDVSFRPGKPEFQVIPDKQRTQMLGVSVPTMGLELRTQIEGMVAAKYREKGIEYDVRVRLAESQRNLKSNFSTTWVPNVNNSLVRLSDVSVPLSTEGPSKISRQNRRRLVQIEADIAPGAGLGDLMNEVAAILIRDLKIPPSSGSASIAPGSFALARNEKKLSKEMSFDFIGQAENFKELQESIVFAMGAGVLFILLVLASLYESFVTPFTIMLALPLAVCGSVVALAAAGESLNIFSMIGIVMLLGVATKNSILLVDYAHQQVMKGVDRNTAIIRAGKIRLRPILMTTMALIAGTIPIAIGLNEASKQRTSMGVAIVGGLVSSTVLTLLVVPAAYSYIDRFRGWIAGVLQRLFMSPDAITELREELKKTDFDSI
jgi:HAE1 family hydrophobic/amphiphilic exporter-1